MVANDYFDLPVGILLDPERLDAKLNKITAYLTALPRIIRRATPFQVQRLSKYRAEHTTLYASIPPQY